MQHILIPIAFFSAVFLLRQMEKASRKIKVRVILIQCGWLRSRQERANERWADIYCGTVAIHAVIA